MATFYYSRFTVSLSIHTHTHKQTCHLQRQLKTLRKQIKTTNQSHLTSVRMAIIEKSANNKRWKRHRAKGTFPHCWWECKLGQPLLRTVWGSSEH